MSVRTDVINLNVNINGNKAQKDLNDLRKKASDITLAMQGLKKGTQEYIDKSKELAQVTSQMDALKKQIGITALSQKELIAELNKLKALRGSVQPFTKEYKDFSDQIAKVESRLYDVKNNVQGFSSFFSKIKDEIKSFGVLAAGYLGFQFITSQFSNIIKGAGKLSDQLADLRRVAGLTAEEADHLNGRFKNLDTRTSVEGLREIAIIAGKLGVAKEDIYGFTKSVDQLVVSLGDELGNADQITTQLGKILNVFDGKITGDNISRLGNAFVELANTGAATGGFIADFDQRLSGIAKSSGISLGALSGLGAGLEELGGRVESSSTAIQKLILHIAQDIPAAAKVAGLSTEEFSKLFAKDGTEALLKYSEGLVKNKESFEAITASLKDNGEEGARTVETITKLGSSADKLRERIDLGKKAIQENAAITEAFNLKNETFGATLDKLGKEFNKLVTSPGVTNFLKGAVEGALSFIKAIRNIPQFIEENRIALLTLAAGIILLNRQYVISAASVILDTVVKTANAIATRLVAVATTLAQVATASYIVVTNLLSGRIAVATAAQRLWNIALSLGLGPIGKLLTLIGALAVAFGAFGDKLSKAKIEQKAQAELAARAADAYADQVNALERLKSTVTSTTASLAEKKKAYEELIKINPDFVNTLKLDAQGHIQGTTAIDDYIKALKRKAEAQAASELSNELFKKQLQAEKRISDLQSITATTGDKVKSFFGLGVNVNQAKAFALKEANDDLAAIKLEKKFYDDRIEQGVKEQIAADAGKNAAPSAAAAQVVTNIAFIKAKIKDLDDAYEQIDISDKKALAANRASRKALQDQLDALEGKKSPSEKKGESEYERIKKEAAKFYKEIQELKKRADIKGEDPEQEEIDRIKLKYAELLNRAKEFYIKKAIDKKKFNEEEKTLEEAQQQELEAIFQKFLKKRFDESSSKEYEESLLARKEYADKLKLQVAQEYADGKVSKKQYEQALKDIDKDEAADRIIIANDYSGTVKKAATDVYQFKKDLEKKTTQDLIDESEKRKKTAEEDALARAERAVVVSKPNTDARFEAQKALLKLQYDQEVANADLTNDMKLLKEAEYQDAVKQLEQENTQRKIDQVITYVSYFQDALTSLNNFITNRENSLFNKEKANNDKKKKGYKDQLDNKLISQAQYDKKVNNLQEQQDKEERALKRKQAQRDKALSLFNAIISNAEAIIKTMTSVPFPFNIPLAIAQGIVGGLQIAAISNTPLPELGKGDWIRDGKKHSEGGINANIEKDEAVMSARAMTNDKIYTVTGNTAQITSALNSQAGGTNWSGGAIVRSARWVTDKPASLNTGLPKILEQGGIIRPLNTNVPNNNDETTELLKRNNQLLEEHIQVTKEKNERLHAIVSIKEYRLQEKVYDAAQKASSL